MTAREPQLTAVVTAVNLDTPSPPPPSQHRRDGRAWDSQSALRVPGPALSDPDQTQSFLETEWVRAVGTRPGREVPCVRGCAGQTAGAAGVPTGHTATCELLP